MSEATTQTPWAQRLFPAVAFGLFLWLIIWAVVSWPYMLDDALIHLRYADHLLRGGKITYDGVHPSFGTSSLLYVYLLAGLRVLTTSPLLPRMVSTAVYALFFLLLVFDLWRGLPRGEEAHAGFLWLTGMALLAVVVAPSAVRWMNDGMETGLVFVDVLAGIAILRRLLRATRMSLPSLTGAVLYGALTVLLRVELLLLVGCISLTALLEIFRGRFRRLGVEHPLQGVLLACAPLLGGLLAAGLIVLTMHSLLPDTALAKAFGRGSWQSTFHMTAVTVVSSFSFGVGLLLLWLISAVALLRQGRPRLADAPPNALFAFVLLTSALRGQQIQGIRYFGWTLLFPLLWNLQRLGEISPGRKPRPLLLRGLVALLVLFLVALLPAFAWESRTFSRVFRGRNEALETFQRQDLTGLRGRFGIAEDVGFVGYFTQGDLCDPYGLVNGREAAKLLYAQRFEACMARHPVFAFGSREFLQKVKFHQDLTGWFVCGSYPFENVRTRDLHFLVVAPSVVGAACPTEATPLVNKLPHLL